MARPRSLLSDLGFLVGLALVAVLLRTFVFASFVIPSESMLPRLMTGDYLLVAKWPYRWPRPALPARGDVVVFKAPPALTVDYIKRVIGLPGDRIAIRDGRVVLNGATLPRWRIADLRVPITPNSACKPAYRMAIAVDRPEGGMPACRYPRFREMLPGGRTYDIVDIGSTTADTRAEVVVPPGHLYLLGDNRDRSADSRFRAQPRGGVGMVPVGALVGRAEVLFFSTDGSARWPSPASWWRAMRGDRIGERL